MDYVQILIIIQNRDILIKNRHFGKGLALLFGLFSHLIFLSKKCSK